MEPGDVRTIGVVGCGLMGSGIVEIAARVGIDVIFVEPTEDLVAAGRARIEGSTAKAVERDKLTPDDRDALLARVRGVTDLAAFADVDLVIEAATEDPSIKLDTFRTLDAIVRPEVVLGSNTSSIPIATLGAATGRPDRVIGIHFFNPPPVMKLVELTPSLSTSPETVTFARGFGERLGKTVVIAKDHAGFIVNRLVIPYLCAAIRLYDEGFATREDIDVVDDPGDEPSDGSVEAGRFHRARHRVADRRGAPCGVPRPDVCAPASVATDGGRRAPGPQERPRLLRVLSNPAGTGVGKLTPPVSAG